MRLSTPSTTTQVPSDCLNVRFIRSSGWTSEGRSYRREVRTRDGKVTGEYGWATMPEGILRQVLKKEEEFYVSLPYIKSGLPCTRPMSLDKERRIRSGT